MQESDEVRDFSGVHLHRLEMWEPALYAGFQATGSRLRKLPPGKRPGLPARHFHSEGEDSAHFHQKQP